MKRITALLLALTLLLTPALAAQEDAFPALRNYGGFNDVKAADWYYNAVKISYETGLLEGSGGYFSPQNTLTVAETAMATARVHSLLSGGDGDFSGAEPWYQGAVDYLRELNVTGLADPSAEISRLAFFHMLESVLPDSILVSINRITTLPDTADAAILRLYNAGMLTGKDRYGTFDGEATLTRAELAATIARVARAELREQFTPADKPTGTSLSEAALGLDGSTVMASIGGKSVTLETMLYYLLQTVLEQDESIYENYGISIPWEQDDWGSYFKEVAMQRVAEQYAMEDALALADYTLTSADDTRIAATVNSNLTSLASTAQARAEVLRALGLSESTYRQMARSDALYEILSTHLSTNTDKAILSTFLEGQGYLAAKHILVTDATLAQTIYDDLLANKTVANFNTLMNRHTEDTYGLSENPNGYLFVSGDMIDVFEQTTRALSIGGMSAPVKGEFGYHIILRLDPKNHPDAWDTFYEYAPDYYLYRAMDTQRAVSYTTTAAFDGLNVEQLYYQWLNFAQGIYETLDA